VQLFDDSVLEADTTADEVHDILDALRSGNVEELAELFSELREFWGDLAARERAN
jgi:DNA-binding GntR family transcriptional regulator